MTGSSVATVESFELAQRQAKAYAASALVPDGLRGSMESCLVALMLADEMGESRLAVVQNIYFVHGRASWITSYLVSRANRSGKFRGPLRWRTLEKSAENINVECYGNLAGLDAGDSEVAIAVDLRTAIESGWTRYRDKSGKEQTHARWATPGMQEQMLRWRSASWLINLYCPEVKFGLPTREELEDISDTEMKDITPAEAPKLEDFAPTGESKRTRRTKGEMEAARRAADGAAEMGEPDMSETSVDPETGELRAERQHSHHDDGSAGNYSTESVGAPPQPSEQKGDHEIGRPIVATDPPRPPGDDLLAGEGLEIEMVTVRRGERRGQPDYHAWFRALFLPMLRKDAATDPGRAAFRIADNRTHLNAYRVAQPEQTANIQREIDLALAARERGTT